MSPHAVRCHVQNGTKSVPLPCCGRPQDSQLQSGLWEGTFRVRGFRKGREGNQIAHFVKGGTLCMCISLCIIAISKNPSAGRVLDIIRPVALISVLVKLTNRKSPNFYSFRRKLSTWPLSTWVSPRVLYMVCALSTGKQNYLSQQLGQVSAVATLDIAKAFDSVEYPVLLRRLPFI